MARKKKEKAAKAAPPVVTQAIFNTFYAEYSEYRQKADDANAALRGSLKRAKAAGVNTAMMIQARNEQRMDRDKLETQIRDLAQYRAFMGLPTGTQSELFADAVDPVDPSLTAEQREFNAGDQGLAAGKAGHARDSNPHAAGSAEYQAFDRAWLAGQETIAEKLSRPAGGQRRKSGGPSAEHEAAGHA